MSDSAYSEPVKTERIVDQVYARIRNMIVRHELAPGSHLSVPALSDHFGVSRSPVREAVLLAVRDGLAVEKKRSGVFVVDFSAADLRPLFEVREALEGMAARLLAGRCTEDDCAALAGLIDKQDAALEQDDLERFVLLDIDLHRTISERCRNPVLVDAAGNIMLKLRVALRTRVSPAGPRVAFEDHCAIVQAIRDKDEDRAEAAARAHIRQAMERLGVGNTE